MPAESARKYRAYPTEEQAATLNGWCHTARAVWNVALDQRSMVWATWRKTLTAYDQAHDLTEWRGDVDWVRDFPAQAAQQVLANLDQAFKNWWTNPSHFGAPTRKKRGSRMSFRLPGQAVRVRRMNARWAEVRVPKIGWVRFKLGKVSRWPDLAKLRNCTVSVHAGQWHVSFGVALPVKARQPQGERVGLDVGVATTVTLSRGLNGERKLNRPATLTPGEARRLVGLERKKARQHKGSRRYGRTCAAIAKLNARQARRRLDWTHKTSDAICSTWAEVWVEDLSVVNMTASAAGTVEEPGVNVRQKAGLNRAILDESWGELFRQLGYKAQTFNQRPPAWSSQTCSTHGERGIRRSQAVFECPVCGERDADENAAENIETGGHLARSTARRSPRKVAA